jgi:hypothetical protein
VLKLELTSLRAFDSVSLPLDLVADNSPAPIRRHSNGKTVSHAPSPSAPSESSFPPEGFLQVRLEAFAPYAALFRVNPPTFCIRSQSQSLLANASSDNQIS